jgi:hypothetical protein
MVRKFQRRISVGILSTILGFGCVLVSPVGASSLHFTSHQRAQLQAWYRSHHSVIINLAVQVNAPSNFTGHQCSKLLAAVPDGKEEGTIPVASVDKTWDSAVVNILLAAGSCAATTETVAQEEAQLKNGVQELQTVINDFRAAGVKVVIPSPVHATHRLPPTTVPPPPTTTTTPQPAQGAYFACTGSTPDGVDITYGTDSSNLNGASSVPWAANLPLGTNVEYFNVTAQLQGDGSVTCTTTVVYKQGGSTHTVTKSGSADGGYNIASAEICSSFTGGWEAC